MVGRVYQTLKVFMLLSVDPPQRYELYITAKCCVVLHADMLYDYMLHAI